MLFTRRTHVFRLKESCEKTGAICLQLVNANKASIRIGHLYQHGASDFIRPINIVICEIDYLATDSAYFSERHSH